MALDRSLTGIQALKHVVVLMLENRSFDPMPGAPKAPPPNIAGLPGNESNPDSTEADIPVQPKAMFRGQLLPDPHHDFASVDAQIFSGVTAPNRQPNMQGFI